MPLTVLNFSLASGRRAGAGKFVALAEIADPENGLLLLSDFSLDSHHRDIVARWERTTPSGMGMAGYRPAGGGWWRWREGGELCLFGYSAQYGGFDREWLREGLVPGLVFDETKISFE